MTSDVPLPPHPARFVGDPFAAGRFRPEGDLTRTDGRLLGGQGGSVEATRVWLKQELDRGLGSRPAGPTTAAFWDGLRDRVRAATPPGDDA